MSDDVEELFDPVRRITDRLSPYKSLLRLGDEVEPAGDRSIVALDARRKDA